LASLGSDCLSWFMDQAAKTDKQAGDALATLLQMCGTSTGSSTRAAIEDSTQALTAMQAVDVSKLAAAPQAATRALLDPSWSLEVQTDSTSAERTAFSQATVVQVSA
jgi:hypothetical protein